ncbi:MAG: IclR family transcriptional regulator [Pseudomonadota bacterium]
MTQRSGTVEKALSLLPHFGAGRAGLGLSDLARLSGMNKATVLRHLLALQDAGFVEQGAGDTRYFLGPAFATYAALRAASDPFLREVDRVLKGLAAQTGETVFVAAYDGETLTTVALVESTKATRVILDRGARLPLHGTAPGLAVLAWGGAPLLAQVLAQPLARFTERTLCDPNALRDHLAETRAQGYARGQQGFDLDMVGFAAPYFGPGGQVAGAVAVALPVSRATAQVEYTAARALSAAGARLSEAMGGALPPTYRLAISGDGRAL